MFILTHSSRCQPQELTLPKDRNRNHLYPPVGTQKCFEQQLGHRRLKRIGKPIAPSYDRLGQATRGSTKVQRTIRRAGGVVAAVVYLKGFMIITVHWMMLCSSLYNYGYQVLYSATVFGGDGWLGQDNGTGILEWVVECGTAYQALYPFLGSMNTPL